jgi:hypothetical protein
MRVANSTTALETALWQPFSANLVWPLSAGDGVKVVYVQFEDSAGLKSAVYSDSTILDTTDPTGDLYINGGMALTASPAVSLFVTFTETGSGVVQYRVSNSDTMTGAVWKPFTNPINYTLPAGDGEKTVYIQLKDNAGNESAVFNDKITLDSTAPQGSIIITTDAMVYYTHMVTLSLSASDQISAAGDLQMQVSNDAAFSGAAWQPYATSLPWSLQPGGGTHTVYVRYRDGVGNVSSFSASCEVRTYVFLPLTVH